MRVLVTFALDAEFAPWRRLRHFSHIDYDGLQLWRTKIGNAEITALLTGIGSQASAHAMGLMMAMADEDKHFEVCISSGLAGALCETLKVGDVITPKLLVAETAHPEISSDQLQVDADLRKLAVQAGAVSTDCLFTADRLFVKASQKTASASRAESVDMESFEIVKEAGAWGARSVVLRAISDKFNEDLPIDFSLTLTKKHEISFRKVVVEILKNPLALPALVRFGKQSRYAAEQLTKFLDKYVKALGNVRDESRSREMAVG